MKDLKYYILAGVAMWVIGVGALSYIAIHFISKFW